MEKRVKIDHSKVEYDGRSFRRIVDDEAALLKRLKEQQKEMLKEIQEQEPDEDSGAQDKAAAASREAHP